MRRFILVLAGLLALTIGLAAPASASTPCAGGASCDEVDSTFNVDAQFFAQVAYCLSSTNADVKDIDVKNNSSDGQRHAYVVQVRVEEPENVALVSDTVYIDYFEEITWQANMISVPKSRKPYAYIRDANGFVQRLSAWHSEGVYPTWTKAIRDVYSYNTYSCV